MSERPTIYLSNWSSHKSPGHHGPGRKWTIMARPRHWEKGEGSVALLVPRDEDLQAVRSGSISVTEYRQRYLDSRLDRPGDNPFNPWQLKAAVSRDIDPYGVVHVRDCDTLCCACSRAAAAKGECHRVWAAELLRVAGWNVVLDGEELKA